MVTLTFDKGLSTEKKLLLNSYQERPVMNILSGVYSIIITKDSRPQKVSGFAKGGTLATLMAVNSDGIELPICGSYNHIQDFSCVYNDTTKQYSISITLNWMEVEDRAK